MRDTVYFTLPTIIEHLGGSIQLDPTYKHGARFIVLHPYNPLDNPS